MYNKLQFYYALPARYADLLKAQGVSDIHTYCKHKKASSEEERWTINCLLDNGKETFLLEPAPSLKRLDAYLTSLKDQLYWTKRDAAQTSSD